MALPLPPINRFAAGLLGLVDIKQMGQTPAHLGDVVSGVLDMEPFYRAENRVVALGQEPAVTVVGVYPVNPVVPQNKIWIPESIRLRFGSAFPASAGLGATPLIFTQNNTVIWAGPRANVASSATVVQANFLVGYTFTRPFLMMPGWKFGLSVDMAENLGAGVHMNVEATYSQIEF